MRAIFINTADQTVSEIQIENDLQAIYKQIGCQVIQLLDIGEKHGVLVDENGRTANWSTGFRLTDWTPIAGNALIVGLTDDGDFSDAEVPAVLIRRNIEFLDLKVNPLPPPHQAIVAIEGELTLENIAKAKAEAFRQLAE